MFVFGTECHKSIENIINTKTIRIHIGTVTGHWIMSASLGGNLYTTKLKDFSQTNFFKFINKFGIVSISVIENFIFFY